MGPKKKSKANKLARMSDEDRARYLQHRADIEEEARRRKQQLIATFMRNKLKREEVFSRLNLAKINQEWRQILREMKCKELKKDLEFACNNFNRLMTTKNITINALMRELDEAEAQYQTMMMTTMETIENLIVVHRDRLSELDKEYSEDRKAMLLEARKFILMENHSAFKNIENMKMMVYTTAKIGETQKSEQHTSHVVKLNEVSHYLQDVRDLMKTGKDSQINTLWKEYQAILSKYLKDTEDIRREYVVLVQTDWENTTSIQEYSGNVVQATEQIASLKLQIHNIREEQRLNLENLQQQKEQVQALFLKAKKNLLSESNHDGKQRRHLAESVDQVLKLSTMCRKLETQREKVLPWGWCGEDTVKSVVHSDTGAGEERNDSNTSLADVLELDMYVDKDFNFEKMERFWERHNKAELDCIAMEEEKKSLQKENNHLRDLLKQYMTSVALKNNKPYKPDELLSKSNTITIEKITQIPVRRVGTFPNIRGKQSLRRPLTCIEASTCIAVKHHHRKAFSATHAKFL